MSPRFFGHFESVQNIAEFWHVGFVLPKKYCSRVFFAGLLFIFEKKHLQKNAFVMINRADPLL